MGGGRKVVEAKAHQLPVEAIYELAARPNIARVAETPQAVWDEESCTAWLVVERGKHLKAMGHRRKLARETRNSGIGEHDSARNTVGIAADDPCCENAAKNEHDVDPKMSSATGLVLHPEEALLLVQQGLLLLSRRSSPGKILSVEEVQRLALGAGLRQHSYAVLRASTLEAQRASGAETSGADGQAAAGEPHLGAIHATCIAESRSDVVKGAKDAQHLFSESTEPLLAVWRMQETEKKGWRLTAPLCVVLTAGLDDNLQEQAQLGQAQHFAGAETVRVALVADDGQVVFFTVSAPSGATTPPSAPA